MSDDVDFSAGPGLGCRLPQDLTVGCCIAAENDDIGVRVPPDGTPNGATTLAGG